MRVELKNLLIPVLSSALLESHVACRHGALFMEGFFKELLHAQIYLHLSFFISIIKIRVLKTQEPMFRLFHRVRRAHSFSMRAYLYSIR